MGQIGKSSCRLLKRQLFQELRNRHPLLFRKHRQSWKSIRREKKVLKAKQSEIMRSKLYRRVRKLKVVNNEDLQQKHSQETASWHHERDLNPEKRKSQPAEKKSWVEKKKKSSKAKTWSWQTWRWQTSVWNCSIPTCRFWQSKTRDSEDGTQWVHREREKNNEWSSYKEKQMSLLASADRWFR